MADDYDGFRDCIVSQYPRASSYHGRPTQLPMCFLRRRKRTAMSGKRLVYNNLLLSVGSVAPHDGSSGLELFFA
ncbi:hypothetical protein [Paenibacillus chitinolyticus]|uniref:hypothetical protein n=1 Tax=Paenibacillus chitinolyticus TaxID=79263 RepID=UPI00295F2B8C|nr:hypothetical protein [Paenibacillus chitinolyticus]